MLRQARMAWDRRGDLGFTWRGGEVSRLEGFSDAVFGFALTLLVVSLEVPRTFDQLAAAMRQFLAFAICFALLFGVWERHYRFFRRYGLQDGVTVLLNSALLFVVMFYVYPLKFLFTLSVDQIILHRASQVVIGPGEVRALFLIYGVGFAAIFLVYALLYAHAYRHRESLELTEVERALTRAEIVRNLGLVAVAGISMTVAVAVPARLAGLSGLAYFLITAVETVHGSQVGQIRRASVK